MYTLGLFLLAGLAVTFAVRVVRADVAVNYLEPERERSGIGVDLVSNKITPTPVPSAPQIIVFDVNEANPYQIDSPDEVVEFLLAIDAVDPDGNDTIVQYRLDVDEDDDGTIDQTFVWLPGEALPRVALGKGDHRLTLTVTDETVLTAKSAMYVRLYEEAGELEDLPPIANIVSLSPAGGSAPLLVTLRGRAVPDHDSTITRYTWVMGNGATRSGAEIQYTYSEAGTYEVYLQVEDSDGFVANSRVVTVIVEPGDGSTPTATMTIPMMTGTHPSPTPTITNTPTPTNTPAVCGVRFEGALRENQTVIPVTGDVGTEITLTDLTTGEVLAGPLIMGGPFDGHFCDGFVHIVLSDPLRLIENHVVLVESNDGSFDVAIVQSLPTVTPTPTTTFTPTPGSTATLQPADLIIGQPMLIDPLPIMSSQPVSFTVTITNVSDVDIDTLFFVDLYFDVPEESVGASGIPIDYSSGYRAVAGLAAGANLTLTVTSDVGFSDAVNVHTVHAMVDSVLQITETNEENNLSDVIFVQTLPNTPTPTASPTQTPTHTPTPTPVNTEYFIYVPLVRLGLD